ncbi:MAG: hypothetical protein NTV00_06535 [Methylococcales bacterium]|nr:hypothetical protein [Methylococcales bacterium]
MVYSFPVTVKNGQFAIVQGLPINKFSAERMKASENELKDECEAIKHLLA